MTQYQKAYDEVQKELNEQEIAKVKSWMKEILTRIESKKAEKEKLEEELRVLKLDLEDLRQGKLGRIEERQEKSELAKSISPISIYSIGLDSGIARVTNPNLWNYYTSGTYKIGTSTGNTVFYF